MEILNWLEASSIVEGYKIQEYRTFRDGFYIKIKAILKDKSELYIREYSDIKERNYSYHRQDNKGEIIIRWDNSPYHPELANAPHHKHEHNKKEPPQEVTLQSVLKTISNNITF